MPRNFQLKGPRKNNVSYNDHSMQPLPEWNQAQAHKQQNWWTADTHEAYPRLGHHVVSNPNADPSSQKQRRGPNRPFPSCQRGASGGSSSNHQKYKKTGLFYSNSQAVMLSSSEVKEYLLQAAEEGKRRVDEWIISEFEQASIPEGEIIIWEACPMDWQPEKTIVIPQSVNIRYPWDSMQDTGKEQWRRKRSGRDGMMEDMI